LKFGAYTINCTVQGLKFGASIEYVVFFFLPRGV